MCLGKVGGVVDLSADATDLVTDVMAIQMAAPTLGFVFVFKLLPGFTVEFVNGGVDRCRRLGDRIVKEEVDHASELELRREGCWLPVVCGAFALVLIQLGHHTAACGEVVVLHSLVNHLIALVNVGVQVLAGKGAVADIFLEFADVCARVVGWYPFGSPSGFVGSEVGEGGSGNGIECFIPFHFQLIRGEEAPEACVGWRNHLLEAFEDEGSNFSYVLCCLEVLQWKAGLSRMEAF